jgi:DNA-binding NarL/FixJ family response regulator
MTAPLRVLIADDQALVRAGFRAILESAGGIEVVAEAATGEEAVAASRRWQVDVALLDIQMPRLDGLDAAAQILAQPRPPRVIMLTTFDLDEHLYRAMRAGASGFLVKDTPREQLIAAVRTVAAGDALLSSSVARRLVERFTVAARTQASPPPVDRLTSRERDVWKALARGLSNQEIAAELYVSEATVKTHVARVLAKLNLRDRAQAIIAAYETGLIQPHN